LPGGCAAAEEMDPRVKPEGDREATPEDDGEVKPEGDREDSKRRPWCTGSSKAHQRMFPR
jgi:hypothetical protein